MVGCSATPMMGGKHRKGHKTRKVRGGAGYGFGSAITPGTLEVVPNSTSTPMDPSGKVLPDPYSTQGSGNASTLMGGKRRTRKTKKGGKKSRKTKKGGRRNRKMKGGMYGANGVVNSAGAGYGFSGTTPGVTGGIAPATGYASRVGGAPMNEAGVRSA